MRLLSHTFHFCAIFIFQTRPNKESAQSRHVLSEVGLAFSRINAGESIRLVPFKVDDYALSSAMRYYLLHFQIMDGNPPDTNHIQELAEHIASIIKPHQIKPTWKTVYQQQQELEELKLQYSMLEAEVNRLRRKESEKGSSLDVFISYHVSNHSRPFIEKLVKTLESKEISCWYAPRDVKPGRWVDSILNALDKCKVFLLLLDEGANNSGFVYIETVLARTYYNESKNGHPLLLPFQIGELQILPRLYTQLRSFQIFRLCALVR